MANFPGFFVSGGPTTARSSGTVVMDPCRARGPGVDPGRWKEVRDDVSENELDSSSGGRAEADRGKGLGANGDSGDSVMELEKSPRWCSRLRCNARGLLPGLVYVTAGVDDDLPKL